MKHRLKHLKTINELYSDTYRSVRDKTESIDKKNSFNTAYINKFLEEGGDINDVIDDIIEYDTDLDISIDLSSDKYIFKDIIGFEKSKVVLEGGKYFINVVK